MVFWSYRKSFLQPTRMMGRPWQKCRTSEIHCNHTPISTRRNRLWGSEDSQIADKTSYLFLHVVKGVWRVDSEADQDDMRVRVREGA